MIDNVKINVDHHLQNYRGDGEEFEEFELLFTPIRARGLIIGAQTDLENLRILYYPGRRLPFAIRNSLHKYHNRNGSRHNENDYSRQDLISDIGELSDKFGVDLREGTLSGFEYGVNYRDGNPNELIKALGLYRGKMFAPMESSSGVYGKQWRMGEYIIKGYDKTREAQTSRSLRLREQIFRFEIRVRKMRYVRGLEISKVNDLLDKDKFINMGKDLAKKYENIKKTSAPRVIRRAMTATETESYLLAYGNFAENVTKIYTDSSLKRLKAQGLRIGREVVFGSDSNNEFHEYILSHSQTLAE